MQIFNVVLPVTASWVGTVLAFYFGRESFESASQQAQQLIRLTPEQRAAAPVTSIMRSLDSTVHYPIPRGKGDADVKLSDLIAKYTAKASRLPVIDADKRPKYMVHRSRIDSYLASGGKPDHTLEQFIAAQKKAGVEFGTDKGFVVVSQQTTLAEAKRKMEAVHACQDIFITKGGTPDEALTGWISNVRMAKHLQA
jgi:hypothetical protein